MNELRLRKQALGTRNLVGARVEMARKNQGMKQKELLAQLQVNGVDMNASGLSKLEGQIRYVTDYELCGLALGQRKISFNGGVFRKKLRGTLFFFLFWPTYAIMDHTLFRFN